MDSIQQTLDDIRSADKGLQNRAYEAIMESTNSPVGWAYEVWDDVVSDLRHKDNRVRSIAAQLLCNLTKSDPEQRILVDFPQLLNVTRDDRFVTARHCCRHSGRWVWLGQRSGTCTTMEWCSASPNAAPRKTGP